MKTLLIADDDISFNFLLREIFIDSHLDIEVISCYDGLCVMEKAESMTIDLMVLDYHLPKISGLELIEKLHEKNIYPYIIVITGYGDQVMRERAREMDVTAFLEKPFDLRVLDYYVNKVLNLSN